MNNSETVNLREKMAEISSTYYSRVFVYMWALFLSWRTKFLFSLQKVSMVHFASLLFLPFCLRNSHISPFSMLSRHLCGDIQKASPSHEPHKDKWDETIKWIESSSKINFHSISGNTKQDFYPIIKHTELKCRIIKQARNHPRRQSLLGISPTG